MRYTFLLSFLLTLQLPLWSQIGHDLTLFSEDGENFTLIVNGKAVNNTPTSSVTLENIHQKYVGFTVKFEDSRIPVLKEKLVCLTIGTDDTTPTNAVFKIIIKRGKRKVRAVSWTDKMLQEQPLIIIGN